PHPRQVFVPHRCHPRLLRPPASPRAQPDPREVLTVLAPQVHTVHLDDARPGVLELLRQPVLPHPRMLDQVVIAGDDLMVVLQWHGASTLSDGLNLTSRRYI